MGPALIVGILLIGLGAVVLFMGGTFTSREEVLSVGDVSITAEEKHRVPTWVGGGALVAGVLLVAVNLKKRP